jgi:hypothetical protein
MFWDIYDNYESSKCTDEGKDEHKEVDDVMPRKLEQ